MLTIENISVLNTYTSNKNPHTRFIQIIITFYGTCYDALLKVSFDYILLKSVFTLFKSCS